MIVTTLCVVYFYDHELPEQRAQLYRRCVDIMLHESPPDEPGQSLADQGGKPDLNASCWPGRLEMHRANRMLSTRNRRSAYLKTVSIVCQSRATLLPAL
jgi:hypothetical protein